MDMDAVERWLASWNSRDLELHWSLWRDDAEFDDGLMPDGEVYEGIEAIRARYDEIMSFGGHWHVELDLRGERNGELVYESYSRGQAAMPWEGRNGMAIALDESGRVRVLRWRPTVEELLPRGQTP